MRRAKYAGQWDKLRRAHADRADDVRSLHDGVELDLSDPCLVLGGRNGAGKSRLLRSIVAQGDLQTVLIDLHYLAEQALSALRSRHDLAEMAEEYAPLNLSEDTISSVNFVVGREYETIEWSALELEPENADVADRFKWSGDQPLIPYFRVRYAGIDYTSLEMGLGEFCIHFLFWILEQYRDFDSLILLLDEPDAFLPPVGVAKLLDRLMKICLEHHWRLVISTHSEEMIGQARDHQSFVLLRVEEDGQTIAVHSSEDPRAGYALLSQPPVSVVVFCEDESAYVLLRAILDATDFGLSRQVSIVWRDGHGYLRKLRELIPRPPHPDVDFAFVFDGDQRNSVEISTATQWPVYFLPTDHDPDTMLMGLSTESVLLARRLGIEQGRLQQLIDSLEGEDAHDWVNRISQEYGRQVTLRHLAQLWCELHTDEALALATEFKAGLSTILV